jgi:hypothetical protein
MENEKLALLIVSHPEAILEKWIGVQEDISLLDLCHVNKGKIESRVIMINNRNGNPYRDLYLTQGSKPFMEPFGDTEALDCRLNAPLELN